MEVTPVHAYEPLACARVLAQMMKNEMNSIRKKNANCPVRDFGTFMTHDSIAHRIRFRAI